jgi:cell division protein FtsI/penicillin-binding protein 2
MQRGGTMRDIIRSFIKLALTAAATFSVLGMAANTTGKSSTAPATAKKAPAPAKPAARASQTAQKRRAVRAIEPAYASATVGDIVDGEDLMVRRAAVEALGPRAGTVVVVDPNTGRVLSIVNQKLAFKSGFKPCSTIKVVAALAALSEGLIERGTKLRLGMRLTMDLTEALALSNNPYFAQLGTKLGFQRVSYYSRLFGLGEKAGLNIDGEEPGLFPEAPPKEIGVGMMTSYGMGINLTPLELAALMSAIANGGTLYYLQYPRSAQEAGSLAPRVKRHLDIQQFIPELRPGMLGAVEYGTAKRAAYDPNEPIYGKTGTCNDFQSARTHLGWFGAFNETGRAKLVVVVLVTGWGRTTNGALASEIAGNVFKTLSQQNFSASRQGSAPASLVASQSCCGN